MNQHDQIICGDSREVLSGLPDGAVHCCVTSPPYWGLRDYGNDAQIGLEETPAEYVANMTELFREVRRVLRDDGTIWVNLGDTYASSWPCNRRNVIGSGSLPNGKRENRPSRMPQGLKEKDLIGIPWRVAFALQADGWFLRQDIIWHKPNPMPESVTDRCTKAHEYIFLLSKSAKYWYDHEAIKEPSDYTHRRSRSETSRHGTGRNDHDRIVGDLGVEGSRNKRSVWTVTTQPYPGAHFATFPPKLIEPCILAGCPEGGVVLDPFNGSGTTCAAARELGRRYIGIELNAAYCVLAEKRLEQSLLFK